MVSFVFMVGTYDVVECNDCVRGETGLICKQSQWKDVSGVDLLGEVRFRELLSPVCSVHLRIQSCLSQRFTHKN